jgi:hypothetical protein
MEGMNKEKILLDFLEDLTGRAFAKSMTTMTPEVEERWFGDHPDTYCVRLSDSDMEIIIKALNQK